MTTDLAAAYAADVRQMKSFDLGSSEGGAACGAGALSEETLMEAYGEMSRLLGRIRTFERANNLPPTKWDYAGSSRTEGA